MGTDCIKMDDGRLILIIMGGVINLLSCYTLVFYSNTFSWIIAVIGIFFVYLSITWEWNYCINQNRKLQMVNNRFRNLGLVCDDE